MNTASDSGERLPAMTVPNQWALALNAYQGWQVASAQAPGTTKLRLYYLNRFSAYVARPFDVELDDLVAFMSRHPQWKPDTKKAARAALRSFYSWAVTTGCMESDPSLSMPRVRAPKGLPNPTSETTLSRSLSTANDRDELMLMLGAFAGLRAGEIARLAWVDIDERIRVLGKGGKVRVVPVHPRLRTALDAERARRENGLTGEGYRYGDPASPYLFPGQSGGPITSGAVTKILKRVTGVKGHGLRHRFATVIHESGEDILVIAQLLGHASTDTTRIYTRVSDQRLRRAVEAA